VGRVAVQIAHNGGWDEIALIVAPLLAVGGFLWCANNWAKKRAEPEQ